MENNEQTKEPVKNNSKGSWFWNGLFWVGVKCHSGLAGLALKHGVDPYEPRFRVKLDGLKGGILKVNAFVKVAYDKGKKNMENKGFSLQSSPHAVFKQNNDEEDQADNQNLSDSLMNWSNGHYDHIIDVLQKYINHDNKPVANVYTPGMNGKQLEQSDKKCQTYRDLLAKFPAMANYINVDDKGMLHANEFKTEEKTNNASEQNAQNTENADPFLLLLGNLWEKGKNGVFGFAVKYRYLGLFKMMLPHVNPHEVYFSTRFGDVEMRANTLTYLAHQWVVSSNQTDNAGKAAHQENAFMFRRSKGQHVNPVGKQPVAQILTHPHNLKKPRDEWTWNTYSDLGKPVVSDSLISTVFESEKNFSAFMQLFTPHEERQR